MDYDLTDIPVTYDRGRDHGPEVLARWMDAIESYVPGRTISRILDLGCGTGRFSEGLAARFNADVVGIDPSTKMLERAREKRCDGRVYYERGRAEAIPVPSRSVDMIFMSMSFHHFGEPRVATRECRRVLCEPGRVFVRTGTREQIPSYPYVPFFPSTLPMLEELLPDNAQLRHAFEAAGFHLVAAEIIAQTIAPSWAAYAEKLSAGGDSVLARLSREEMDHGLAAIRSHGDAASDQNVVELIDLFVFE